MWRRGDCLLAQQGEPGSRSPAARLALGVILRGCHVQGAMCHGASSGFLAHGASHLAHSDSARSQGRNLMNDTSLLSNPLVRMGGLLLLCVGPLWWVGYRLHRSWTPSAGNDVLGLPRVLGFLFGSTRRGQRFVVRGLLCQLLAYEIMIMGTLAVFGGISLETGRTVLMWSLAFFCLSAIGVYLSATRRR